MLNFIMELNEQQLPQLKIEILHKKTAPFRGFFFIAKKNKVNQHILAINLGKGIEMKNLDKKNVRPLSLDVPLTFP